MNIIYRFLAYYLPTWTKHHRAYGFLKPESVCLKQTRILCRSSLKMCIQSHLLLDCSTFDPSNEFSINFLLLPGSVGLVKNWLVYNEGKLSFNLLWVGLSETALCAWLKLRLWRRLYCMVYKVIMWVVW